MLVKTILLSLALVSATSFVTARSDIADIDMVLNNGTVVIQEHKSLEPKTNAEAIALGLPLLRPRSLPWTKPSRTWSAQKRQASIRRVTRTLNFDDLPPINGGASLPIPIGYNDVLWSSSSTYLTSSYYSLAPASPAHSLLVLASQGGPGSEYQPQNPIISGSQIILQSLKCSHMNSNNGVVRIYGKMAHMSPYDRDERSYYAVAACAGIAGGAPATYNSWPDMPPVDYLVFGPHDTTGGFQGTIDDLQISYLV